MNRIKHKFTVLKQICEVIPAYLVAKLANKHKVDARRFSQWSHVVALLYGQLAHAFSLNDICDALNNHPGKLDEIRHATPPARNTFSNANRSRPPEMAEELFWKVLDHCRKASPTFGQKRRYKKLPRRLRRAINAVDSTTIQLVANCLDWAKHRRRKAAAKLHLSLNLQTFLPRMVVVDPAKFHDNPRAREVCAPLQAGEIVVFDKAYVDFQHLHDLTGRGIFGVTRAKDNLQYEVIEKRPLPERTVKTLRVISDEVIRLQTSTSLEAYPEELRRVEAEVEIDGKMTRMVFLTNNLEWAASSICDLYACRWGIETFFKEVKQTLQLSDFFGYNANAVKWQVWTALLAYLLLRYQQFLCQWARPFRRLFTFLRAILWDRLDAGKLLRS